eukprot:1195255-Prymnesium_polylepis.1
MGSGSWGACGCGSCDGGGATAAAAGVQASHRRSASDPPPEAALLPADSGGVTRLLVRASSCLSCASGCECGGSPVAQRAPS